MKRIISLLLILVLCMSLASVGLCQDISAAASTEKVHIERSAQKLTVDGKAIDCEKYNIGGNNYFKLRDLAYLLRGTERQFSVDYDAASAAVLIETGKTYVPVGGELSIDEDKSSGAAPTRQTIKLNGVTVSDLSVYNIGGNNYFKLRELGSLIGFGVDYDPSTNTASVTTDGVAGVTVWLCVEQRCSDGFVYSYSYDSKGNMLSFNCSSFPDIDSTYNYTYDADGHVLTSEHIDSSGEKEVTVYTYDESGNMLTQNLSTSKGYFENYVYSYDADGNLIREKKTASNGGSIYTDYTYDANNKLLAEKTTSSEGSSYGYEYTYDASGNLLTKIGKVNGQYRDTRAYTYDANGKLLSEIFQNVSGYSWGYYYSYDMYGRLSSEKEIIDGHDELSSSFTYDENGNLLTSKTTDSNGNEMTSVFKYIAITV